jgi:hypothetical protein
MDNSRLVDRVRKMLALSKDQAATPGEAANAAEMAAKLIDKYNLDVAALNAESGVEVEFVDEPYAVGREKWRMFLLNGVCRTSYCRMAMANNGVAAIVGQPHNVEVVTFLYEYLAAEVCRMADFGWETVGAGLEHPWKANFKMGATAAILGRLKDRAFGVSDEDSTALVRHSGVMLDFAFRAFHPNAEGTTVAVNGIDGAAWAYGAAAGHNVPINAAIQGE